MKYFDGALARVMANLKARDAVEKNSGVTEAIKNEVASGKVVLAGATEFTTGKDVEDALYTIWKKTLPMFVSPKAQICYGLGNLGFI